MKSNTKKKHLDHFEEDLAQEIELICVNTRSQEEYVSGVLMAVARSTWIKDLNCVISASGQSGRSDDQAKEKRERHEGKMRSLPKPAEALYKTGATHEPRDQITSTIRNSRNRRKKREAIKYAGLTIGEMQYSESLSEERSKMEKSIVVTAARYIAYALKREEARRWCLDRLGYVISQTGCSRQLHRIEQLIESASSISFPIHIQGEHGTEKLKTAITIHALSNRKESSFIEVDCSNPHADLENALKKVGMGSLCLSNIDSLPLSKQNLLKSMIPSRLGQWIGSRSTESARIMSTSSMNLRKLAVEGNFLPALYEELSVLNITIPPVRDRSVDIPSIITDCMAELGLKKTYCLHENAMSALCAYRWPGNLYEIKKLLASMSMLPDGSDIDIMDLCDYAPWLISQPLDAGNYKSQGQRVQEGKRDSSNLENWLRDFGKEKDKASKRLHEGLRKAISTLLDRYAEPLTLNELARIVSLSPSHLGYLFRVEAKASFKIIQHSIRIAKAKKLLKEEQQMTVSMIAELAGYADLSHFERVFRRRVGMRPGDYRRTGGQ